MLNTWCSMPSCWATRRASSTSATEQDPESEAPPHSLSVAPGTSWPCSTRRAAATEESTPPDIATRTRMDPVCHRGSAAPAQRSDDRGHHVEGAVDFCVGGRVPEREADRTGGQPGCDAHRGQHVARLERAAGTGRPAGDAHPLPAECHQQLLALHTRDADVEV